MADSTPKYSLYGYEVNHAEVDITTSGAGTIVGTASVASDKIIRVISANIQFGTGTSFQFINQTGTQVGATIYDSSVLPENHGGWFETDVSGDGLVGTVDGNAAGITITYLKVDAGAA